MNNECFFLQKGGLFSFFAVISVIRIYVIIENVQYSLISKDWHASGYAGDFSHQIIMSVSG